MTRFRSKGKARDRSLSEALLKTLSRIPPNCESRVDVTYAIDGPVLVRTTFAPRGNLADYLRDHEARSCTRRFHYGLDASVRVVGCESSDCPICSRD